MLICSSTKKNMLDTAVQPHLKIDIPHSSMSALFGLKASCMKLLQLHVPRTCNLSTHKSRLVHMSRSAIVYALFSRRSRSGVSRLYRNLRRRETVGHLLPMGGASCMPTDHHLICLHPSIITYFDHMESKSITVVLFASCALVTRRFESRNFRLKSENIKKRKPESGK